MTIDRQTLTRTAAVLTTLVVWATLGGCGKNPSAAPAREGTIQSRPTSKSAAAKTIAKLPTATAKAATATKTSATPAKAGAAPVASAAAGTTSVSATPAPTGSPAAATGPGAIKLTIKVSGNAPVAAVGLHIFDQRDPTQASDVPLTLVAGQAIWEQKDVPAARYTLQIKALAGDGNVLGQGSSEAVVTSGQISDVTLDLRVNTAAPPGDEGKVNVAATPTPTSSTAPTATPAPGGGTLGLNLEII